MKYLLWAISALAIAYGISKIQLTFHFYIYLQNPSFEPQEMSEGFQEEVNAI